jgi:hypothetical protein
LFLSTLGTFRPEQVQVGQVLFEGDEVPAAEFAHRACG